MQDLRFALRMFARTPGLTVGILLTLALGIGVNATALSWLEALVLRPLPGVRAAADMVVIVSNRGGGGVSLPDLRDFGNLAAAVDGAAATMPTPARLTVGDEALWVDGQIVTANFFALLGVEALQGRVFRPEEDRHPGGDAVVVISERLWRTRFGADPAIVGRPVELNRQPFTVIGVTPAAFRGTNLPSYADFWAPASMITEVRGQSRNFLDRRADRGWHSLARLAPGVTVAQAATAVAAAGERLAQAFPDTNRDVRHRVLPFRQSPWGAESAVGPALRLLVVVGLGLQLIVTANVANLLLARAVGRRKEVAVRLAAGASRARLVRQFLLESVLLAGVGAALGLLLASWLTGLLPLLLPAEIGARTTLETPLGPWSAAAAAGLGLATGLLFGLAPALVATRADVNVVLKETGRSGHPGGRRLRAGLVAAEITLAVMLLIGAGLCLRGLRQAERIDVGFSRDRVLLGPLQIGMNGYGQEDGLRFYREIRARVAALPGVEDVALASWLPLGLAGCKGLVVTVEGYARPAGEDLIVEYAIVSPGYFPTLRIPLVAGRGFGPGDTGGAPDVAVVNEAFARRYWPGQEALGRRFRAGGRWRTVVGVARTGKYNRLDEPAWPFFYLPD